MHSSANALCKLYLSVIDDVIENVRETFLDEGVEEGVLNELRKSGTGAVTTFSLPPGVTYPVHIPAGVTLQTASGHFYKVNVPVVVTQAPRSNRVFPQSSGQQVPPAPPHPQPGPKPAQTTVQQAPKPTILKPVLTASSSATVPGPQPGGAVTQTVTQAGQQAQAPPAAVDGGPQTPVSQLAPKPPPPPPPVTPQSVPESPGEFTLEGIEFTPQPELNLKKEIPSQSQAPEVAEENMGGVDTPEKEVKEETPEGLPVSDGTAFSSLGSQLDEAIKMELMRDFDYDGLEDIVQLDGACDGSSEEEDVDIGGAVGENDFLGMISAEALHVLEEAGGSEDSSSTSGSDIEQQEVVEELDPLNSGDDVSEQDIPDLFDTDNVIVCQYEKIHRSKNRWKFNLRDGVMCYGGKDYVFSRAIGEAEW